MDYDCYGYSPTYNQGCPGGCGTQDNVEWGKANGKSSTKSKKKKRPRVLGHVIVVPSGVDLDEFTRRWVDESGVYFRYSGEFVVHDEYALAMVICSKMGGGACHEWIKSELYPGFWETMGPLPMYEESALGAIGGRNLGPNANPLNPKNPACPGNSFDPDTPVLMANGSSKPIEDVRIGDEVLATDPETGQTAAREVTATIIGSGLKGLAKVIVDTDGEHGDATAQIIATGGHPFWNALTRQWTNAEDLRSGDHIGTPSGVQVAVVDIVIYTAVTAVRNLSVDDIHTYYVLAGNTPVLVHNDGCGIAWGPTQLQKKFKHASDFGVTGNYSKENAKSFENALETHIHNPNTVVIRGTYRGDAVTHHYNPNTGINVIVDPQGNFVSGWKLGQAQTQNLLSHGGLT